MTWRRHSHFQLSTQLSWATAAAENFLVGREKKWKRQKHFFSFFVLSLFKGEGKFHICRNNLSGVKNGWCRRKALFPTRQTRYTVQGLWDLLNFNRVKILTVIKAAYPLVKGVDKTRKTSNPGDGSLLCVCLRKCFNLFGWAGALVSLQRPVLKAERNKSREWAAYFLYFLSLAITNIFVMSLWPFWKGSPLASPQCHCLAKKDQKSKALL